MEFDIRWTSATAQHREMYLARRANVWRDIFPPGLEEWLKGAGPGDRETVRYGPGEAVAPYREDKVLARRRSEFRPPTVAGRRLEPRFGRFYPKGALLRIPGIFPENIYPFRIIGLEETSLTADLNHPLALCSLEVGVRIPENARKDSDVSGSCATWMEDVLDRGPGMQARWRGQPTDFWSPEGFRRQDERDDAGFHARPRMVGHVDSLASSFIRKEHERYLRPGMKVLDLMSSVQSHLPADMELTVLGLGMNREELAGNPRLDGYRVQDLNADPSLPFPDAEFDLAVCSLSVEYLVRPLAVMRELSRVLQQGGRCLISFSDRWHPTKAIALWSELNEFERMGLVQEYFLQSGGFCDVHTVSRRNWWRPEDDRLFGERPACDPVYVVSARAANSGA
jgi:SAM-dependent methyltransferase/FKBP-type peptidyl-prolyl cis-trans isomerase 2